MEAREKEFILIHRNHVLNVFWFQSLSKPKGKKNKKGKKVTNFFLVYLITSWNFSWSFLSINDSEFLEGLKNSFSQYFTSCMFSTNIWIRIPIVLSLSSSGIKNPNTCSVPCCTVMLCITEQCVIWIRDSNWRMYQLVRMRNCVSSVNLESLQLSGYSYWR